MALLEIDRELIKDCLAHKENSWESLVDRFLGLVVHVINHTAGSRGIKLEPSDREDLVSEVFVTLLADDFGLLRKFRGESSLATYFTVIARRVVVRELNKFKNLPTTANEPSSAATTDTATDELLNRDEVEQLLTHLNDDEARIVRMHYLEGKSYEEISSTTGVPSNSIGPTISRAKAKIRRTSVNS